MNDGHARRVAQSRPVFGANSTKAPAAYRGGGHRQRLGSTFLAHQRRDDLWLNSAWEQTNEVALGYVRLSAGFETIANPTGAGSVGAADDHDQGFTVGDFGLPNLAGLDLGSLSVHSDGPGTGATFSLDLPFVPNK